MICATIEIWPYGFNDAAIEIGKLAIWNRGHWYGSTPEHGNYGYCVTRDFDDRWSDTSKPIPTDAELIDLIRTANEDDPDYDFRDDRIIGHGRIDGYPRRDGAHGLVAACLIDAGLADWYLTDQTEKVFGPFTEDAA